MAKNVNKAEDKIVAVEEALSKTEHFIENNQKILSIVVGVIILVVSGYFAYQKLYVTPMEKEARSQMFMAEMYFAKDSLDLALNGDGNYLGFLDIIDEYGSSKPAKLANYYAGICLLKKGEFENAIDYLKSYSIKDKVIATMATGAIGDAYLELKDYKKATTYYLEAAKKDNNSFTSPIFLLKAGRAYEIQQEYSKAASTYERILNEYKLSMEARNIEKDIARAQGLAK
ncbi:MAG: tetratricopeptide repeat protein [Bacteroidetes bacterium]|nr:tetratricopeptide repeat protein [Bacteroidota bacterium]